MLVSDAFGSWRTSASSAASFSRPASNDATPRIVESISSAVTERGVVYVAGSGTPTTADTKVAIGSGTGSFSQAVTGLAAGTAYTVRAYATVAG